MFRQRSQVAAAHDLLTSNHAQACEESEGKHAVARSISAFAKRLGAQKFSMGVVQRPKSDYEAPFYFESAEGRMVIGTARVDSATCLATILAGDVIETAIH